LDSYTTGDMSEGAIYRALPVYRVTSPERPDTPEILPKLNTAMGIKESNGNVLASRRPTRRVIRASVVH